MKKKAVIALLTCALSASMITGCGKEKKIEQTSKAMELEAGDKVGNQTEVTVNATVKPEETASADNSSSDNKSTGNAGSTANSGGNSSNVQFFMHVSFRS